MRVKTEDLAKRAGEGLLTSFMRKLLRVGQIGGSSTIISSVKKTNRLVITCAACVGGLGAEIVTWTTSFPLHILNENDVSPINVQDLERVDLVLVTHAAWDHLGDTLEIGLKFEEVLL